MTWKFWHKNGGPVEKQPKLSRPKDLPSPVGRLIVVEMGQDPDWVWGLKCVMQPLDTPAGAFDLRVFDPIQALNQSVEVKSFAALDDHPDLVLYAGIFKKKENLFQVLKKAA